MPRLIDSELEGFGRVVHAPDTYMTPAELMAEIEEYFRDGIRIERGDVVFDVGANIGAFAIHTAVQCRGDVSLYCFEPAPLSFAALEKNAIENEHLARARPKLFNVALSSIEEAGRSTELHYFSKFPADSTLDLEQKREDLEHYFAHHGSRVKDRIAGAVPGAVGRGLGAIAGEAVARAPTSALGRWGVSRFMGLERVTCAQDAIAPFVARASIERIDLLKIDVEGFEPRVLAGIDEATWPRIRQVVLETSRAREEEMLALFERWGFDQRRVSPSFASERGVDYVIISARREVSRAIPR